jgi:type III pantothenate kinase
MLLVIDSGNTNAVFAIYDGADKRGEWRAASNSRRTADEYAVWLTQLMTLAGLSTGDITGAVLSNVVPAAQWALDQLCQRYFGIRPLTVEEAVAGYDMPIRIDRPEQVGADRLANAVAAHSDYGGALIVVDFGTATTFDLIDPDGAYSGGIIAPGINLSMEALYGAAAKLPRISVEKPREVVGYDTVSAMQSGVFWGYIGLIEGIIARIRGERGEHHRVVATGGLAPLFHETTAAIDYLDSDLTLRGLVMLYRAIHKDAQ